MIKTNIAPRAYALKRPLKTMTPMTAASRPKLWRNDITGLRALAVLPVLIFHAFPSLIPGGFFGVDVFFVISGYLISGIIFRGIASSSFSYLEFYEKRIKRIIPNLILLLTFVAAAGWFILLPDEYANLGMHIDVTNAIGRTIIRMPAMAVLHCFSAHLYADLALKPFCEDDWHRCCSHCIGFTRSLPLLFGSQFCLLLPIDSLLGIRCRHSFVLF